MNQFSARSENLLGSPKPLIFGTKSDFFPFSKNKIQNFPNLKYFISSEPHKSQFSARSENFLYDQNSQFSEQNQIFSNLKKWNPKFSKFK